MEPVRRKVLEQVLAGTVEPVVIVRVDQPDWPVALSNPASDTPVMALMSGTRPAKAPQTMPIMTMITMVARDARRDAENVMKTLQILR